jgi:hypothetical protein
MVGRVKDGIVPLFRHSAVLPQQYAVHLLQFAAEGKDITIAYNLHTFNSFINAFFDIAIIIYGQII